MNDITHLAGVNIGAPIIYLSHDDVVPAGDSLYRFECPECIQGIILPAGDLLPGELITMAYCCLCGQSYQFLGIPHSVMDSEEVDFYEKTAGYIIDSMKEW